MDPLKFIARCFNKNGKSYDTIVDSFRPPATLGAPREVQLAMDSSLEESGIYNYLLQNYNSMSANGVHSQFLGYARLSALQQNGLIRAGVETVADELTRKWIELTSFSTENDDEDNVSNLEKELEKFNLKEVFHQAAIYTGYFGGCLVYIDTGVHDPEELKSPLFLDEYLFDVGSLKKFIPIEPINVYPGKYNASNPTESDYFNPNTWWVLGREYHASRFLYFSANDLPLLLKPSYNFFGISMSQIALEYVEHFTRTRDAAVRLLTKFSLTALKTNLLGILQGQGDEDLQRRVQYFLQMQSNDGCMVIDKETEEIMKLDTSLSGVTDIVRQSLELLSAIYRIPAVKLLGISPSGFNATGESDIRNYYDHISSQQEKIFYTPLKKAIDVIQMNAFKKISDTISFKFVALNEEDRKQNVEINKIKSDMDCQYLDRGVIMPEMVLERLSTDKESGYNFIETQDILEADIDHQEEQEPTEMVETQSIESGSSIQEVSLNGAQVTSIIDIVSQVAQGLLPRDSGIAMLYTAFPIDKARAETIMGTVGNSFTIANTQTTETGYVK